MTVKYYSTVFKGELEKKKKKKDYPFRIIQSEFYIHC